MANPFDCDGIWLRCALHAHVEVLERDAAGLLSAVRVRRPAGTPFARIEVADLAGNRAWTNPLWT